MWTKLLSTDTVKVVIGPIEQAAAYARRRGWKLGDYVIVTDPDELHSMDPPSIAEIFTVQLRHLGPDVAAALRHEIDLLKALWPVRVQVVAR